jgi:6-pyruvoyltetrahydropterin/6-carboxytetrahydropterin synthase
MKASVTRLYRFSASHRLHLHQLSEDENTRLYGKCNNPYGHGHDYVLSVTAQGPVDPETGHVLRIAELDALVENCVLRLFRDRNINLDVPQFRDLVATTENIAKVVSDLLRDNWDGYISSSGTLRRVHVQETDRNGSEVVIPAPAENLPSGSERTKVAV